MRQRDRFTGQVWLDTVHGSRTSGLVDGALPTHLRPEEALHTLGHEYRLVVEMRKDGDTYVLRAAPMPGNRAAGRPWWAVAYRGTSVRDALACMVHDYDVVLGYPDTATWSPREVERWAI